MDPKEYLEKFFALKQLSVTEKRQALFEDFCSEEKYIQAAARILELQDMLMADYKLKLRISDITQQQVQVPNGTVGKPYEARLDRPALQWEDIAAHELELPPELGLTYDPVIGSISGIPQSAGDFRPLLKFRLAEEPEDTAWHEKRLSLIINPDPKSLWKNIASDPEARFAKEDEAAAFAPMGDRHIVVASKRGRSHANTGLFRDDDVAFRNFSEYGWSVIALSDGAGSALYSREGSRVACNSIISYFETQFAGGGFAALDHLLGTPGFEADAARQQEISRFIYQKLGGAAQYAFKQLEGLAAAEAITLQDLHATLIFTLVKKYSAGYALLTFGVGDCPIGVVYNNMSAVSPLNTLDVGEFGGGTRFLTQAEIFRSEDMAGRLRFKIVPSFDYLVMMSDGIYDPKFEVEANLGMIEQWKAFIADLEGNNADKAAVHFDPANKNIAQELLAWMDFWSPGNHDDRTLAILF